MLKFSVSAHHHQEADVIYAEIQLTYDHVYNIGTIYCMYFTFYMHLKCLSTIKSKHLEIAICFNVFKIQYAKSNKLQLQLPQSSHF